MDSSEIIFWNRKVGLLEKASNIIAADSTKRPKSFYEGIALYLSEAYLLPVSKEEAEYGHTTQRAA